MYACGLSFSLSLPLPSTSNQQSNIRTYVRKRVGAGNLTFDIIYFDTRIDRPRYSLRYSPPFFSFSPPVSPVQFSTLVFPSSVLARVKLVFPCLNSRRKQGKENNRTEQIDNAASLEMKKKTCTIKNTWKKRASGLEGARIDRQLPARIPTCRL